ncbi:hypothetical protein IIA28_09380 [candidate division KSB1 bacterium]|nr:hypothetical protein [candidate division KSB1 bacterium]
MLACSGVEVAECTRVPACQKRGRFRGKPITGTDPAGAVTAFFEDD